MLGDNRYGNMVIIQQHGEYVFQMLLYVMVIKEDGSRLLLETITVGEQTSCAVELN